MRKCQLGIELEGVRDSKAGKPITGSIVVRVLRQCRCEALNLSWRWSSLDGAGPHVGPCESLVTVRLQEEWRPGQLLRYPFRLKAPCSPLSFQGEALSVDWFLCAEASLVDMGASPPEACFVSLFPTRKRGPDPSLHAPVQDVPPPPAPPHSLDLSEVAPCLQVDEPGQVSALLNRRRARQCQSLWGELCQRLELVPEPGVGWRGSGRLQGVGFSLSVVGTEWFLELPISRLLLPPGMLLISEKAPRLRPKVRLRRLWLDFFSASPNPLAWYVGWDTPPCKLEVPLPYLEEAWYAGAAHAPLRVEPHRLVQNLGAGRQLSVDDVRKAVRTLDATVRQWLDAAGRHGLPRVEALPRA